MEVRSPDTRHVLNRHGTDGADGKNRAPPALSVTVINMQISWNGECTERENQSVCYTYTDSRQMFAKWDVVPTWSIGIHYLFALLPVVFLGSSFRSLRVLGSREVGGAVVTAAGSQPQRCMMARLSQLLQQRQIALWQAEQYVSELKRKTRCYGSRITHWLTLEGATSSCTLCLED